MEAIYDVVVIGGGVSGSIAALASARTGAKTVLIEEYGFLGGTLTNGGVGPMMTFHAGKRQVVKGIPQEIVDELVALGASPGHITDTIGFASSVTPFDAEMLKFVLQEKLLADKVDLIFHAKFLACQCEQEKIKSISIATKSGELQLKGKVFIDCSGDGDLAARAGVPCQLGRIEDNLCQPVTMTAKLNQVDIAQIRSYMKQNPDQFLLNDVESLDTAPRLSVQGFYDAVRDGRKNQQITFNRDIVLFFETNNPGEVVLNMTRVQGIDSTDYRQLTKGEIEGRRQVHQAVSFLRNNIPGFEKAVLIATGPHIGVRESRKIKGKYTLTAEDLISQRIFPDTIALGGYPIDIHQVDGEGVTAMHLPPGGVYSIPYRALIANINNLLVAGRCISSTHQANAAIRVSPIAMATGHAAGVAAAIAGRKDGRVDAIDIDLLQQTLISQHAVLR